MNEIDSQLVRMCIDAATSSNDAIESWRRQRRTLERMPSQIAAALLHRLLRRRLLYPSLLEVFKYSVEEIDLRGETSVDAEWMAYIGAFQYLHSLTLADCHKINSSCIWVLTGMTKLKKVDLSRCSKVTDTGIRHLASIPSLEELYISETSVSTEGVMLLSTLENLSVLDLGGLPVTDFALNALKVLEKLQYLDLWGSDLSDKGVALLEMFPRLNFLNLAWTRVTSLPTLSSLSCLNMSNCSINSLSDGQKDDAPITELVLSGAAIRNITQAFQCINLSCISLLDLSNASLGSFSFLANMDAIVHLDLSGTPLGEDSIELLAQVGANLTYLNLSSTRLSSDGVKVLAGHVPKLETFLLSSTSLDDGAISYLSMMPSLKIISLSSTKVTGMMNQVGDESSAVSSFSSLHILSDLEKLDLDNTRIEDFALCPLSSFQRLSSLFLRSSYLTDTCLHYLASVKTLVNLSIRDAVLTNSGVASFMPPSTLKLLDLRGCWLLTKDVLFLFNQQHPQIELRHENFNIVPQEERSLKQKARWSTGMRTNIATFPDQRVKYSREELLALQFSSTSMSDSSKEGC